MTGETSGDQLAAAIVAELRSREHVDAAGWIGPDAQGIARLGDRPAGAMGLWDGARAAYRAMQTRREIVDWARIHRPALLLTVDAPSFTLRVSEAVRSLGIPAVHVVAPQVWAWRPGRVARLGKQTDALMCLLPFEPAWFEGHVRARFVGHPGLALGTGPAVGPRPAVALLPGSRAGEVQRHAPILRQVARRLASIRPDLSFVTVRAPGAPALTGVEVTEVPSLQALSGVEGAVVASGTASLQLAAMGVPQVVIYRTDPVTWTIGRRLVTNPWLSLPNIVAGRRVVAEHLQHLDADAIVRDLLAARPVTLPDLSADGAVGRIADELMTWLDVA